jgi:putative spermidine/putrescine transport system permease protein
LAVSSASLPLTAGEGVAPRRPEAVPSAVPVKVASDTVRWTAYLPLVPAVVVLFMLLIIPLMVTVYLSLSPNVLIQFDGLGLNNYLYLLSKPYYVDVLSRTLRVAVLTMFFSLLIGYPAAYILKDISDRNSGTLIIGLTFPILAGPLVVVLGWMILLADGGPLIRPFVRNGITGPWKLLGTDAAIIIGLVHFTLPFVILTIYASLKQIPLQLYEAARSLGAGSVQVFRQVVLPLSMPGVLSAAIIAFSLSAGSYVSPHYLGGATRLMMTTLVGQFVLSTFNGEMAAAAAVVLLLIMVVAIFSLMRLASRYIR